MTQKWKVLTLLNVALVAGDLLVYPKSDPFFLLGDFFDEEANFGIDIPEKGISTGVVVASPDHGCGPAGILPPPNVPNPPNHWAVLIRRYNCSFEEKVLNAQNAFYDVAIIHNVNSNALEIMNASHPELIHIMAVFISANSGKEIRTRYLYEQGFIVQIEPNSAGHILGKILIPFIVVISACFVLMVGFMILKCIKDHRRACRRRMPHSALDKIPTTKYRKNDPYETCAICLDDFVEGEKLRVLPCSHAYHSKCIDPWLTRNRRVCPMCKRKVFAADERVEDNGSSSEDDDHTPLLRGRNAPPRQGGLPAIRRLALQHPEMQTIGDVIRSFGLERERQEPQPGSWLEQSSSSDASSPSGSSSSSSNQSTGDRSWDQFQQVIQRILKNGSEAEPHHEDHHGAPAQSQSPHPHGSADSAPQTEAQLHDPHGADFEDSTHHESHSVDSYHDDDHHQVTFHDDSGHHDVAHDDTYDTHSLGC